MQSLTQAQLAAGLKRFIGNNHRHISGSDLVHMAKCVVVLETHLDLAGQPDHIKYQSHFEQPAEGK